VASLRTLGGRFREVTDLVTEHHPDSVLDYSCSQLRTALRLLLAPEALPRDAPRRRTTEGVADSGYNKQTASRANLEINVLHTHTLRLSKGSICKLLARVEGVCLSVCLSVCLASQSDCAQSSPRRGGYEVLVGRLEM